MGEVSTPRGAKSGERPTNASLCNQQQDRNGNQSEVGADLKAKIGPARPMRIRAIRPGGVQSFLGVVKEDPGEDQADEEGSQDQHFTAGIQRRAGTDESLHKHAPTESVERGAVYEKQADRVIEAPRAVSGRYRVALAWIDGEFPVHALCQPSSHRHPRRYGRPREHGTQKRRAEPVPHPPIVFQTGQSQKEQQQEWHAAMSSARNNRQSPCFYSNALRRTWKRSTSRDAIVLDKPARSGMAVCASAKQSIFWRFLLRI